MRKRREEQLVNAYADWREVSRLVDDAYRLWVSGTEVDARVAFLRRTAAVDAAEFPADVYADLVRRVGRLVAIGPAR